jgi:hypothetical protein
MDAVILVNSSCAMRPRMSEISTALRKTAAVLSPGVRVAIVCYTDVTDDIPVRTVLDFCDDPVEIDRAASRLACREAAGGARAQSQHLALTTLLSPSALSWRAPDAVSAVVLHFTDTGPHSAVSSEVAPEPLAQERAAVLLETGRPADWLALGRALYRASVRVFCFLFPGPRFAEAAPWHAAMAELTGADGVVVPGGVWELSRRVAGLLDGVTVYEGSRVRLCAEAAERLHETPDEPNARHILCDVSGLRVDGPDKDIRVALSTAFRGLVRHDADNARSFYAPSAQESCLRRGHAELVEAVGKALADNPQTAEEEDVCDVVTSATYREMCEEFCGRSPGPSLSGLFDAVAGIVVGPAICAPFTSKTGKFNYQTSFGVRVRAVRTGYRMSYASFLEYARSKRCGAADSACRASLRRGVDDLVLRKDGDITGILPQIAEDAPLARAVFKALARTAWLDAVAWHSACRHVFPPPHACLGLLASAFWGACCDDALPVSCLELMAESVMQLPPARAVPGSEACKHAAALLRTREFGPLIKAAVRERCAGIPKGRAAFLADSRTGTYYRPSSHAAACDGVRRAVLRLASVRGLVPPCDLEESVAREVFVRLFDGAETVTEAARKYGEVGAPARPPPSTGRSTLPTLGTARFNRRLSRLAVDFRRAGGKAITGRRGEVFVVRPEDLTEDDESPGARLVRANGEAEFSFVEGVWTPTRLGRVVREAEDRGGRTVYVWKP